MSLKKVNSALVAAYQSIGQGLTTAYEGKDFTPPAGSWAKVTNIPATQGVASLGDGGYDRMSGIFQIDYAAGENSGTKTLLDYVDQAMQVFKNGVSFVYSGQTVKVRRIDLSAIRKDPDSTFLKISLSVYWDSIVTR